MKKLTIQSIFDEDPEGGFPLRGDPYLWNILRARMHGWVDPSIASPDTKIEDVHDELDKIVMDMYKKTTGKKLEGEGGDLCKFIQKISYGMSAGFFERKWWIETALPMLHERIERLVGRCTSESNHPLCELLVISGDLLKRKEDAIVNPTNTNLASESGLSGAIFKAGGPRLLAACRGINKNEAGERCSVGEAVATIGGELPNGHVIHTVGPNCQRGVTDDAKDKLRSCYINCLQTAKELKIKSIAIPSIATGKYAFPVEEAAKIMAEILVRETYCAGLEKIVFCCPDAKALTAYRTACRELYKLYKK